MDETTDSYLSGESRMKVPTWPFILWASFLLVDGCLPPLCALPGPLSISSHKEPSSSQRSTSTPSYKPNRLSEVLPEYLHPGDEGGACSTVFWISLRESLAAQVSIQHPTQSVSFRSPCYQPTAVLGACQSESAIKFCL